MQRLYNCFWGREQGTGNREQGTGGAGGAGGAGEEGEKRRQGEKFLLQECLLQ